MNARRRGITLLEVLVVAGIMGVLIALSMPAIQKVRATADSMGCKSRLNQIGLALALFHQDYGRLPRAQHARSTFIRDLTIMDSGGWYVQILPYIEQQALWRQAVSAWEQSQRPYEVPPHQGNLTPVKAFICPADTRLEQPQPDPGGRLAAFSSYLGVRGSGRGVNERTDDGVLYPRMRAGISFNEISDGLSNTLMVGERPPPNNFQAGRWYANMVAWGWGYRMGPEQSHFVEQRWAPMDGCVPPFFFSVGRLDNPCDRWHFWSLHPGGAHFLFADGSARFLAYTAKDLMPALATRAGGEKVMLD